MKKKQYMDEILKRINDNSPVKCDDCGKVDNISHVIVNHQYEDIKIVCQDKLIRVSGVRVRTQFPGTKRVHQMEVDYGPFEKLFRISSALNIDDIHASSKNGLLELVLPRKKAEEPVQIVIEYERF